eukprot:scaffold66122_cov69-Phaeocystis_antarctica.AAC.4
MNLLTSRHLQHASGGAGKVAARVRGCGTLRGVALVWESYAGLEARRRGCGTRLRCAFDGGGAGAGAARAQRRVAPLRPRRCPESSLWLCTHPQLRGAHRALADSENLWAIHRKLVVTSLDSARAAPRGAARSSGSDRGAGRHPCGEGGAGAGC